MKWVRRRRGGGREGVLTLWINSVKSPKGVKGSGCVDDFEGTEVFK